jgi:hypothetical protein
MKTPPQSNAAQEAVISPTEHFGGERPLFETVFVSAAGGATIGDYFGRYGAIIGAIAGGILGAFVVLHDHG